MPELFWMWMFLMQYMSGHFGKHFIKNTRRREAPQGKIIEFFLQDTIVITSWMENPMMDIMRAFLSKVRTLFWFSKKAGEASCPLLSSYVLLSLVGPLLSSYVLVSLVGPLLSSYVLLSLVEFVSISLNIPKYTRKCFNKLFWLSQGSEYAWSSYMFEKLLKITPVLNKPGFWIWHDCICKGYTEFQTSDYTWIIPEYASTCLNNAQYAWTLLNIAECPWLSLNKLSWLCQGSQYAVF